MSMNLSPRKRLSVVLATPLGNYAAGEWVILCSCASCCRHAELRVTQLLARHSTRKVADVVARLRCRICRGGPHAVILQSVPYSVPGHAEIVQLVGPGAYG